MDNDSDPKSLIKKKKLLVKNGESSQTSRTPLPVFKCSFKNQKREIQDGSIESVWTHLLPCMYQIYTYIQRNFTKGITDDWVNTFCTRRDRETIWKMTGEMEIGWRERNPLPAQHLAVGRNPTEGPECRFASSGERIQNCRLKGN